MLMQIFHKYFTHSQWHCSIIKIISGRMYSKKSDAFFEEYKHLSVVKDNIPEKYFKSKIRKPPDHMYLICPEIAKVVANHVLKATKQNNSDQLICETNAGLGLITQILLENGLPLVRMFEQCQLFRLHLAEVAEKFPNRVELFTKDIFQLSRYSYIDKQDKGNRVEILLKDVPKRPLSGDPVMTVIGSMPTKTFLKYLIETYVLQTGIFSYGRIQLFAFMHPRDYAVFVSTPEDSVRIYQKWSIISRFFMEFELLEKVPRNMFLPWSLNSSRFIYPNPQDADVMYLAKINIKKQCVIPDEQLLPFFFFVKQFYGNGNKPVVPTIEKWIPNCGLNIIAPKLNHGDDYFHNMSIFTKMRELNPKQIFEVFKEVTNFPSYSESPFYAMLENELVKMETIDSSIDSSVVEPTIVKDLEMKLN